MKKKLPNIYKGIVNKNLNQTETYVNKEQKEENEYMRIYEQIKKIFNSSSFIYKADTIITLNNGEKIKKTIIGKNNNSLITMDDELIDISSIIKIEQV